MRSRTSRRSAVVAAALALATLSACGAGSAGEPGGGTIKIGELYSLSGSLASLGVPLDQGFSLAIDEVNTAGGINGKKLELVRADYKSDTTQAVPKFRELVGKGVVAIGGPESAVISSTLEPLATATKVPMVAGSGTSPTTPFAFSVYPTTGYFDLMAQYVKAQGKEPMCAFVVPGASQQIQEKSAFPVFQQNGVPVRSVIPHEQAATDLTPQMSIVRSDGCKSVYEGSTGASVLASAQAMANLGMNDSVLVTVGSNANSEVVKALGANAKYVYFALPKAAVATQLPASDPQRAQLMHFYDSFVAKYQSPPPPSSVIGYIIGTQIIAGLQAGNTTGETLQKWLDTATLPTILGTYARTPQQHNGAASAGYFVMGRFDPATSTFVLGGASAQ
ncbi:hypothetical protein GCM10009836_37550 [Pseudonocardia ailaonensis]|uniref:Leucine-binding protein domain-containing protein n=1 Tax=Pseudonocardia ailaonensis TaxID=367279 RepID=A0ABN2N5U5_9PSEU